MPGGVGQHRLKPLARSALLFAALLGFAARGAQTVDEVVAGALELGDVDEPAGLGCGEDIALTAGGLRVGREAPLQARDLVAKGAAGSGLIATLDGRRLQDLEIRHPQVLRVGVAAGVEDAREVAGVDACVPGRVGSSRGKLLDRRRGGAGSDEGSLALP